MTTSPPRPAQSRKIALPVAEHRLLVRVARLYYESGLTQAQIGEFLGLSRMKVNRLLGLAMKAGVVQIEFIEPEEPHAELLSRVKSEFQLRDAKVVSDALPEQTTQAVLGAAAADWLAERLLHDLVVGLGLGRTVALIPQTFSVPRPVRCRFVTLEGVGVSPNADFAAYDVAGRLAELSGGTAGIISAPTFVSSPSVRSVLLAEPAVSASLEVARKADLMIQSVGSVTTDSLLVQHGTLSPGELRRLQRAGAVGDALGHFFGADGEHIPWPTDELHVGLTLDDLKVCSTSALVAGGEDKVLAIRGAIRGQFANALITDVATAERLLELGP
jgi:lsr operon transcriptional repressor